eukprot:1137235-Pelagomonas_calceolata.AAC.4
MECSYILDNAAPGDQASLIPCTSGPDTTVLLHQWTRSALIAASAHHHRATAAGNLWAIPTVPGQLHWSRSCTSGPGQPLSLRQWNNSISGNCCRPSLGNCCTSGPVQLQFLASLASRPYTFPLMQACY